MENAHTREDLKYYQSLPLNIKIAMSKRRIRDFIREYGESGVCVSVSGKDSSALLHLIREDYPNVKGVFVDTGLEFPSVKECNAKKENVDIVRPEKDFKTVLIEYGYPIIGKIYDLFENYEGAEYMTTGEKRTGCIFCMFGIMFQKDRFVKMIKKHPKIIDYVLRGGAFGEDGMWKPDNRGLGFWFVIKWLNVHGNLGIELPNENEYIEKYGTEETAKHLVNDELKTS